MAISINISFVNSSTLKLTSPIRNFVESHLPESRIAFQGVLRFLIQDKEDIHSSSKNLKPLWGLFGL